jgi:hypothetical protein
MMTDAASLTVISAYPLFGVDTKTTGQLLARGLHRKVEKGVSTLELL